MGNTCEPNLWQRDYWFCQASGYLAKQNDAVAAHVEGSRTVVNDRYFKYFQNVVKVSQLNSRVVPRDRREAPCPSSAPS